MITVALPLSDGTITILVSPLRPLVVLHCWRVRFGFGGFACQRALLTPSLRASAISSPVGVSGPLTHLFFLHSPLFVFIFFCTVSFYLLRASCTTSSPYYISHLHYAVVQLTKAFIVETSCCLMKFVSSFAQEKVFTQTIYLISYCTEAWQKQKYNNLEMIAAHG